MDWAATATCAALSIAAYRWSQRGERAYAAALMANVAIFNISMFFTPPEADPGLNLILELGLFEVAVLSAIITGHTRPYLELVSISVLSMIVSANEAFHVWSIDGYYLAVNALFAAECGIIGRRGIADVVGGVFRVVRDRSRDGRVLDGAGVPHHGLAPISRSAEHRRA